MCKKGFRECLVNVYVHGHLRDVENITILKSALITDNVDCTGMNAGEYLHQ